MSGKARTRPPYKGTERNLVIAIDFGTTFSGISYAVLDPGMPPRVHSVTGYPGQEDISSSTKVPTVMYYDAEGNVCVAGAETNDPDLMGVDGSEEWIKLEWFKFLLRPKNSQFPETDAPAPILPPGKTITDVLSDFFKYLYDCVRGFIQRTHAGGQILWEEVHKRANFVLSHPNGWDGFQQGIMRNAAIAAKMVDDSDDGRSRVHFVSEGEASFHWCVEIGLADGVLKLGTHIVVADCGGGTIDVSAYQVKKEDPLNLEETKAAQCRLAGSVFVTRAFENYVQGFLKGSDWGNPDTIERLAQAFDNKTKKLFKTESPNMTVPFGTPRENSTAFGIRAGKLTVSRPIGAGFFERSCTAAVDAIKEHIQGNQSTIVFLVGGFAASPYLLTEVERRLDGHKVSIKRAESHTAKAVADGAISFYLDHFISARVAKYTYGVYGNPTYNPNNMEHISRQHRVYTEGWSGRKLVAGGFYPHLIKGTVANETREWRLAFSDAVGSTKKAFDAKFTLCCYKGNKRDIRWIDEERNAFREVCTFTGRVHESCLVKGTSARGNIFWKANYTAVVRFGTTEFTCHVEWKTEEGVIKRGPMTAVWDEG